MAYVEHRSAMSPSRRQGRYQVYLIPASNGKGLGWRADLSHAFHWRAFAHSRMVPNALEAWRRARRASFTNGPRDREGRRVEVDH